MRDPNERTTPYEEAWDDYADRWSELHPDLAHLGDEWTGRAAGAARSVEEYCEKIDRELIAPYVEPTDTVVELGIGGGRTAALLLERCERLICADPAANMLRETRRRLGHDRVSYVKTDGVTLDPLPSASADVFFCFDTMVHIEPRDIFHYLVQIPRLLRGKRLCVFHHADTLSELGFAKFLGEWRNSLGGERHGTSFSVMTPAIMRRFLTHLSYEIVREDREIVPRDCAWVCRAPDSKSSA